MVTAEQARLIASNPGLQEALQAIENQARKGGSCDFRVSSSTYNNEYKRNKMVTKTQQLREVAINAVQPVADMIEQEIDRVAKEGFMRCEMKTISQPVLQELRTRGIHFTQKTKKANFVFDWSKDPEPETSDLPWDQ